MTQREGELRAALGIDAGVRARRQSPRRPGRAPRLGRGRIVSVPPASDHDVLPQRSDDPAARWLRAGTRELKGHDDGDREIRRRWLSFFESRGHCGALGATAL